MRKRLAFAAVLSLSLACSLVGQSSNASVGGFVQDPSRAYIPGVTVTATNVETGVVTTAVSNETGTYNIPSLLPGTYKLTAELPGFRTHIYNDVRLGANAVGRYNFTMEVGTLTEAVEVVATSTALLAEASATIGQVLNENSIRDLPLVSNNVLDLLTTVAGVRGSATAGSFAGISTSYVNTTRDGISVTENRYINGVSSTTVINPDLVGEMRVILTPVDAETGRGNGQVQILTRSGTNTFRGSAVWTVRNSAFDANTWSNNSTIVNGAWQPTTPDWTNRHEATASYGGPIVKNKTFFFALYDQQIERRRSTQRPVVLTDCARNGIFRYWEGWANGNINTVTSTVGSNPTRASVDSFGNPLRPTTNANGTPYNGQLRYFSMFGPVLNTPLRPDCSDAVVGNTPWDTLRTKLDPAGISQKYLTVMPQANLFDGGDGLNTAVHQWVRPAHSSGSLNLGSGTDNDAGRQQINLKIDQNFNARHKVAVNYSYDWINADYGLNTWPGGFGSELQRRPQVLTVNFTSTLTPSLLNEARAGFRQNWHIILAPWEVTNEEARKIPESMLLQGGGFPIAYIPATVGGMTPNSYSCFTNCAQQGNKTPLYQYGDTLSWTKGKHAFKGGGEVRFGHSAGSETPTAPIPKATGGAGQNPNQAFVNNPNLPGLVTNNQTLANSLLYFLAGSVGSAQQYYFIQSANHQGKWLNYNDVPNHRKVTDSHQNEFSFFFKDDWKVLPSFTANLGLRYDYFGVPWEGQGLTAVPQGGGLALFGVSGRSFDKWLNPNAGMNLDLVTNLEFVGPKTQNPDKSAYRKDRNNFGPAIGFAWQLPWFGKGKTNVRGGYQVTYSGGNRYVNLANYLFSNQGFVNLAQTTGPTDGRYFDLTNLPGLFPLPPNSSPMAPVPILKQNVSAYAFDPNYATPYVQNMTLSVTRQVTQSFNLDVRYIATRGIKLYSDLFDLNTANVYYNPALFDALERTRRGENVALFDQMFLGLNLNPGLTGCNPAVPSQACGVVNGTTQTGSQHLRLNSTFRANLANGDYEAVANSLNTFNGIGTSVPLSVGGERGAVLRRANKGFNVPGGTTIAGGPVVPSGLFPENWIVSNPQYAAANLFSNSGSSNYHSLQVQGTLRPTYGLTLQGTYVFSKALAVPTTGYTNPADRQIDYALSGNHVSHDFRTNGTFELPIGPGKLLMRNSSGLLARLLEHWQMGFIVNLNTGSPTSITAGNMLYGNGVADVLAPLELRKGAVRWGDEGATGQLVGNYFGNGVFGKVADPQCGEVAADLRSFCTLQAVTDGASGQIVLQNPRPGQKGTIGRQTIELPGNWSFDGNASKSFKISESKTFQLRVDATNVLNHPSPGTPSLSINSQNAFGYIASKGTQHREFKATLRLNF